MVVAAQLSAIAEFRRVRSRSLFSLFLHQYHPPIFARRAPPHRYSAVLPAARIARDYGGFTVVAIGTRDSMPHPDPYVYQDFWFRKTLSPFCSVT